MLYGEFLFDCDVFDASMPLCLVLFSSEKFCAVHKLIT